MIKMSMLQTLTPEKIIPSLVIWVVLIALGIVLTVKKKVSIKFMIPGLLVSLIVSGIILNAVPNPVLPIQQILNNIKMSGPIQTILPMIIILIVLIVTGLIIGRSFCGFACPLGGLQELASKIRFKSKYKKSNPKTIKIPKLYSKIIQYSFLVIFVVVGIIWGMSVVQLLSPFEGFKLFNFPVLPAILIPSIFLGVILVLGFFYYRPYCTLLCPFGALVSITSRFALFKIRRTSDCNECQLCEKICPTEESYADSVKDECYQCGRCIETCPKDALKYSKKT
jgi:polyferredoxin